MVGKEGKLISSSAFSVQLLDDGRALICENYDPDRRMGELVYHDEKVSRVIETDVEAFVYLNETTK
ncbi:MAG: hypothetical protein E7B18_11370 [Clostridium sp.]|nr:hypothetical protein [Clostridium sp.]